jgi:poly-gamma-glutamate synthesis protein (capsule biosynthesis protein)
MGPWLPALITGLAALVGGAALLGAALGRYVNHSDATPIRTAEARTDAPPGSPLRYTGTLPAGLSPAELVAAGPGEAADLSFSPALSPGKGVVTRYWAWVISPHAGIDSLTAMQLQTLIDGRATLDSAGGIGGHLEVVMTALDLPTATRFGLHPPPTPRESYAAIRAEMADPRHPPILALVPLQEVRPEMMAIAVDGIDIVRGRGDPAPWWPVDRTVVEGLSPRGQAVASGLAERITARLPRTTRVVTTGDILLSRCTLARIRSSGDWAAPLRSPTGEFLAAADLALGSLDGSIQDIGAPYGCVATTNLTSPPPVIETLKIAGIDEVTVATNHVADCGEGTCGMRALTRTLELLHEAGIETVGGGSNLEEALAPIVIERNGVRFGILGFDDIAAEDLQASATSPGTAPLDDSYDDERDTPPREPAFYKPAEMLGVSRLQERIRALKSRVDVVIVQVQSGTEDTHDPSPRSIKGLRAAAEAGADLVVGNQAHWVQAVEFRDSAFIAYALGNFIFDQQHTRAHEEGFLLEATFHEKRLANIRLVPYRIREQLHPTFVDEAGRTKILGDVWDASRRLAGER